MEGGQAMGIVLDILVLIQCIAKICVWFDVFASLSELVYRVITLIICIIKISAYFNKRKAKGRPLAKDAPEQNAGK